MIAGRAIAICAGIVLARVLGPEEYGIYAYAMACIGVLAVLTSVGIPQYLTRMIAVYRIENKLNLMHGLITTSNASVALISTTTSILLSILLHFNYSNNNGNIFIYYWTLALLPIISISSIRRGVFEGIQMVASGKFFEEVLRPSLFIIFIILSISITGEIKIEHVMKIQFLAFLITLIIGSYYLKINIKELKNKKPDRNIATWVKNLSPFLLISYTSIITTQADILILGIFEETEKVGLYRVASQIGLLTSFFIYMAGSVISPKLANLSAQGRNEEMQKIIIHYSMMSFLCCGILFLIIFTSGTNILSIMFGDSYTNAWAPTIIISLGYLLSCPFALSGNTLNMIGKANSTAKIYTISAIINVALNFILIPHFGNIGAASAFSITLVAYQTTTAYILHQEYNLGIISYIKTALIK